MSYIVNFQPLAKRDMVDIAKYISEKLASPQAAMRLGEKLVAKAENLSKMPYANPVYMPIRPLLHEYRRAAVENYLMFYWVDEINKAVIIVRVIYGKRNYQELPELKT